MRGADDRLIQAIVGAVLATTLLVAAFAVIAQEPAATDPPGARPADPGATSHCPRDRHA
jgi:hypothetical protein